MTTLADQSTASFKTAEDVVAWIVSFRDYTAKAAEVVESYRLHGQQQDRAAFRRMLRELRKDASQSQIEVLWKAEKCLTAYELREAQE